MNKKFIRGTYIYIVCSDLGFAFEPDVEIVNVFLNYSCAKEYCNYKNRLHDKSGFILPYYIIKKRVILNE